MNNIWNVPIGTKVLFIAGYFKGKTGKIIGYDNIKNNWFAMVKFDSKMTNIETKISHHPVAMVNIMDMHKQLRTK